MRTPEPVVLEGHGVRLEPLGEQHVDDLLAAAADPRTWAHTGPQPHSAADVLGWRAQPGRHPFAVVVDGRARGSTSYGDVDLDVAGLEIGWTWYAPELWGGTVNPACKLLLLQQAFDALGAQRVTLKTDGRNARSQAAIRRLGARYDGTLRHHRRRPDGTVRDSAYFSVLAAEWPAVRDGLHARLAAPGR